MDSINKIDATVTQLLRHTKELLFALEQWAYGKCTEEQVSDEYVKLGNEFNLACRYFVKAGIEVDDLGDVTVSLRKILETALSEQQCQETLDDCLPSIREIIVTLLRQLKHKQALLRQRATHKRAESNASSSSFGSQKSRRTPSAVSSKSSGPSAPPTGAPSGPSASGHPAPVLPSQSPKRMPSDAAERPERPERAADRSGPDAFSQLQKSHLERRASKRYSSYNMQKAMNGEVLPTLSSHMAVPADYTDASVVEDRMRRMPSVQESPMAPTGPMAATMGPMATQHPSPTPSTPQDTTVFLRLDKKVRKGQLKGPYALPAIRLLFVDLFGYTPSPGSVFPDINIQDHDTGVEYELTEATLRDIKQGTLLSLVKKSDEDDAVEKQIKDLVAAVQDLSTKVDTRLGLAARPGSGGLGGGLGSSGFGSTPSLPKPAAGPRVPSDSTDGFRQQLAVMRQICSKTVGSMRQEVKVIQAQITSLKHANAGTNRAYMTASQKKLTEDTQNILSWVDDLQDIVEGQRKDVSTRGVRLSQKQLDGVSRDILKASQDLRQLQEYIAKENPTWVKTWETELNTVVEEQQFFKLQEQLVTDLEADLANTRKTFELVEQCALQFSKSDVRPKMVGPAPTQGDVEDAQTGLLSEIVALRPNHAQRAEAIERAEQLRRRELAQRSDEFKQELGDFVETGMLKQSGGVEEVERRRRERDEMIRSEQSRTDAEALQLKEAAKEAAREERRRERERERERERQEDS